MTTKPNTFSKSLFFPTLVFQINVANATALNKDLLKAVYKDRKEDEAGIIRSNVKQHGGWHSKIHLHKQTAYKELVRNINSATRRMSTELNYNKDFAIRIGSMWSIVNPPGSFNIAHVHPGCLWSGVYYIQAPKDSGNIEFVEPRTVHLMNQPNFVPKERRPTECWTKVNFTPVEGKMIIFPAWLYHSVRTNESTKSGKAGDRVIISFNLNQQKINKSKK